MIFAREKKESHVFGGNLRRSTWIWPTDCKEKVISFVRVGSIGGQWRVLRQIRALAERIAVRVVCFLTPFLAPLIMVARRLLFREKLPQVMRIVSKEAARSRGGRGYKS